MPETKKGFETTYKNTGEATRYKDGEEVTVTMTNGCRANGKIELAGENARVKGGGGSNYGNSTLRDADTGEVIYRVKITSGPHKGLSYTAHESQLTPGWNGSDTCAAAAPFKESNTDSAGVTNGAEHGTDHSLTIALVVAFVAIMIMARSSGGRFVSA